MDCTRARKLLFRNLDAELSAAEAGDLSDHVSGCASCTREKRVLAIPRQIGNTFPVLQPSPYFYSRLKARLDQESQPLTVWQLMLTISRQLVPAFAALTLALLSIFAYYQVRGRQEDRAYAYDLVLHSLDRRQAIILGAQGEINDESFLVTLIEDENGHSVAPVSEKRDSK
jgi:hypothetical protein